MSNTALGGQVLLDETTFLGIKEELWRFGLVTASGLKRDAGLVGQGGSRGAKRSAGRRMADCLICRYGYLLDVFGCWGCRKLLKAKQPL